MVLNDAKIYFAVGEAATATFSADKVLTRVAAYGLPVETVDTVERTYFNDDHVKKYGTGYSDMGDVTIKVDLDEDNVEQIAEIKGYMTARTEVAFGYIVDKAMTDLNVKWSGVITSVSEVDGDITPGVNAQASITIKPCTRLTPFVAPVDAE